VDLLSLLSFAAAMFVLAITPGPGVLAVTARGLSCGFVNAMVMATGILLGDIFFIMLACYGLNVVAVNLHELFLIIRYAGSAYLVWMGLSMLFARAREGEGIAAIPVASGVSMTPRSCFSSLAMGFSVTLGNPKVIFFYLGFLPTFVDLRHLSHVDVALICVTAFGVSMFVLAGYVFLALRTRRLVSSARARTGLHRVAGGVLVATGVALASDG